MVWKLGSGRESAVKHENNFDLLRLLAAAQVMVLHSVAHLHLPINAPLLRVLSAFPGVAIFFVISGFLVSRSYLNPAMTRPIFFDHRVRRIYPALWVNLIVLLIALAVTGCLLTDNPARRALWILVTFITGSDWIGSAVAGHINRDGFYTNFPSGVLWTIPVELCFYLLVPTIFAKKFTRERMIVSVVAWAAVSLVVWCIWAKAGHPYSIAKNLWIFLIGATINLYWDRIKPLFDGTALIWFSVYLAVSLLNPSFDYSTASVPNFIQTLLLAGTAISFASSFRPLNGLLRGSDISYGLYLWHMPVIWTLVGLGVVGQWRWAILAYAIAGALAMSSWLVVERPFIRNKRALIPAPGNARYRASTLN